MAQVNHHLARVFKVYGYPPVYAGLDLAQPPIRFLRVAHQHTWFKKFRHCAPHCCKRTLLLPEKPDLIALLGSRICHDLISPIGAIGNGVELLLMDGAGNSPEMALISESVAHASARIRFFRVAFGGAGGDQRISQTEVKTILSDMTRGGRLLVDWQTPGDLSRREVKLAFLLILSLETAMINGGRIHVERTSARWVLTGRAPRLRIDPLLWEVLSNPAAPAEIGPAQVHFLLVPEEVNRQHRRLTVEISEPEIRLSF